MKGNIKSWINQRWQNQEPLLITTVVRVATTMTGCPDLSRLLVVNGVVVTNAAKTVKSHWMTL
jgi:hypothetical protein